MLISVNYQILTINKNLHLLHTPIIYLSLISPMAHVMGREIRILKVLHLSKPSGTILRYSYWHYFIGFIC